MDEPLVTGIHAVTITVSDLGPHLRLYRDALDWEVIGETTLPEELVARRWGVRSPAHLLRLSPPNAATGQLRLVRFPALRPASLGHPPIRVNGFFAIDMYVRDLDEARRRVAAAGAMWAADARWEIEAPSCTVVVRQGLVRAPDDVNLVFVRAEEPRPTAVWAADPSAFCTELTSVVLGTPDVEHSKRFWGPQGLGLRIAYDAAFTQPEMSRMVGVEETSAFRMALGVGATTARLEILGRAPDPHSAVPSADLARRQRPGVSLGQTAWTIRVSDLDRAMAVMAAQGAEIVQAATPIPEGGPELSSGRAAAVVSPEGAWLEVLERDPPTPPGGA
jgi:catechol 2,3-dioxygenase-like lactoylglutathione lyase family enzyme